MKKGIVIVVMCCAFVLALGLAACGGSPSGGSASSASSAASPASTSATESGSPASSAASPASASSAVNGGSAASASSASTSSGAAAASAASASQGALQITMGELSMVNVHGTDTGVGADVVVQVQNTGNAPLVLSNPNIKIADESGKIIVDESGNGIFTGPSYLGVGDVGFIYSSGPIPLPAGYFPGYNYLAQASAELTACKSVHEFPISNSQIADDGNGMPVVTGTVSNNDIEKASLIEITAVYLDNEGYMLGVASEPVVNLEPGQSRDFAIHGDFLPVGCSLAVVANYDVIAVAPKH